MIPKMLLVSTLYYPDNVGGVEHALGSLMREANRNGFEAAVLCTYSGKVFEEQRSSEHGTVYRAPLVNIYHPMGGQSQRPLHSKVLWHVINTFHTNPWFAKTLDRFRPDLVCTNNLFGFGTGTWLGTRSPARIMHYIRDYSLLCTKATMYARAQNCRRQCSGCVEIATINKVRSRRVHGVVSNSQFALKRHQDLGFFPNATVRRAIGSGVDLQKLQSIRPPAFPPRTFGYIGRLSPEKGVERLLEAFVVLRDPNLTLRIAGSGSQDYIKKLRGLVPPEMSESVHLVGTVPAEEFLSTIDVLVVPSLWNEPFGRTIVEGMASSRPVIVAALGGARELVGEGERGYAYDGSLSGLLQSMRTALSSPEASVVKCRAALDHARLLSEELVAASFFGSAREVLN